MQARSVFISHGGGPLPLLGDEQHTEMIETLGSIRDSIETPECIIVVSAHWEKRVPTILSRSEPKLFYDYSGFPPESYEINYPCVGDIDVAGEIVRMFDENGIEHQVEEERGYDHGVFVPLKIMYPDADIPVIQLSLKTGLDPLKHIEIGKSIARLPDNVLILGSGFSFHNMRAFFNPDGGREENEAFEQWLVDTCTNKELNEPDRQQALLEWTNAPGARFCHPREEHLLPLHVCYGAARSNASKVFSARILGRQSSMYIWN